MGEECTHASLDPGIDGVVQARGFELAADETVDDRLDVVLDLLVERGDGLVERDDLPVDAGADVAVLAEFFEHVAVFALASPDDRGEDHHGGAGGELDRKPVLQEIIQAKTEGNQSDSSPHKEAQITGRGKYVGKYNRL